MPVAQLAQSSPKAPPGVLYLRSKTPKADDHSVQSNKMTFDRAQLVEDYIQQLIEGMDYKTMECLVYDTLKDNLSDYIDEQLITEVEEYNPELLQDVPV